MLVSKNKVYELAIIGVAYGGKGFSKINDFIVFVDNTVTGDIVEVKIFKKRENYAEGRVLKYVKYSGHRVNALCRYSGVCGGCKWQFLSYEQQLIYKHQHILEAIEHISLIKNIKVNPVIPSYNIFGYRNKMEFSCSDRRWFLEEEKKLDSNDKSLFGIGLHVPGTFYKVIDISYCLLQPSLGNKILNDVRSFIKTSKQPPYGLKSHKGFWRFLVVRYSVTNNHWMINIVTSSYDASTVKYLADSLMDNYKNIVSIVNTITTNKAGITNGERKINLAGQNTIRERIGNYNFDISADSFFQTNTKGAQKLYDVIRDLSELSGNELILDLYCGTGTISIYLSSMARKVIGIDIIESAIHDARNNCNLNGVKNCNFIQGDVKDEMMNINIKADVLIIDPPRMGMHKKTVKKILNMSPSKIIYVSCNPSTLARDLLLLKTNYEIEIVQPIDMFPHTFHIESVVKMKRKNV